ncbi:MAG TPA: NAD(+) kinase [Acidiferrobacterales bacterium]|nr:NAD(+) kinase [Acidiferrobacterales bacterium]
MPTVKNPPIKTPIKTIGLFGKYGGKDLGEIIRGLGEFLRTRKLNILLEQETAALIKDSTTPSRAITAMGKEIDLAIVVGGDGSMLQVARGLAAYRVPLIGVKLGRLGFLADVSTQNMQQALGDILEGHFQTEERFMLDAEIVRAGRVIQTANAFNDVVINKGERARLIEYETYVDGEFVSDARADGVIVATPTGSTAYALSAGGPIVHPAVPAIVLAPICPHTLSNRPIVVNSDCKIEIVMKNLQNAAYVSFDGQSDHLLQDSDRVRIRRADTPVTLIHPAQRSHYEVLRAKLHWSNKF